MIALLASSRRLLRRFATDRAGASAVEFAFILPVMITIYLGGVEVTQGISADRKVTAATSAVGDLVAQAETIEPAEMQGIFAAAVAILAPFPAGSLGITVSSVQITEDGASVLCSQAFQMDPRPVGSAIDLPEGVAVPNSTLIVAESRYTYDSMFGQIFSEPIILGDTFYLRPRAVDEIDLNCA